MSQGRSTDRRIPELVKKIALAVATTALFGGGGLLVLSHLRAGREAGMDLNARAWSASYRERGATPPEQGPREGYWGARLGAKIGDPWLGWREPEKHLPGLLEIDAAGRQSWRSAGERRTRIAIVGGSVAFGAYASSIDATYYAVLGRSLERDGHPAEITVLAAGAWKSIQELNAITLYLREEQPDWVILLDGLNDLTNGATADSLYGQRVETADGSPWNELYHAHDYEARVTSYLQHVEQVVARAEQNGARILVVLQPSLAERASLTALEAELLRGSLLPHTSAAALTGSYAAIRDGLEELEERREGVRFLDASRLFDDMPETTFADLWHFSDFGHRRLGEAISKKLAPLISSAQ